MGCPAKHASLDHIRVHDKQVDISFPSIRPYRYGENVDATRNPLTTKFNYQWKMVKDGQFLRETELRETTKWWTDKYLSLDREVADWVLEPNGAIKKSNLTFTAMFLWLIVCHCLSPTVADNIVT